MGKPFGQGVVYERHQGTEVLRVDGSPVGGGRLRHQSDPVGSSAAPASEAVLSSLLESLPPQAEAAKVIANNVASNRHMVFFRIC